MSAATLVSALAQVSELAARFKTNEESCSTTGW